MSLNQEEVLQQSNSAFNQWRDLWDGHAKRHRAIHEESPTSHQDLLHTGYGKNLLCVGMGPSFEDEIETIKKNRNKFEIACVDKAFTYLMDAGVTPDYVFVADASVDYEKWCSKYIADTENISLVSSVTANPEWAENWKGKVFYYVNKDNIETEKRYGEISGIREMIPAGSNVGNSIIIFATQVMDYDNYFLVGFDFCWGDDDNYYSFNTSDKRYSMRHHYMIDNSMRLVSTSGNLWFSCRWLMDFVKQFHSDKNIFNCSKGVFNWNNVKLSRILKVAKNRKMSEKARNRIIQSKIKKKMFTILDGENAVAKALKELNVASVEINYIPEGALNGITV